MFFKKTFKSLRNQTISFENIEWIIICHNCEYNYIKMIKNIVKDYENVQIFELNNKKRGPASPRNLGLSKANGKFISFLDDDDELVPKTFETCEKYFKLKNPDIISFNYKAIGLSKEGPNFKPVNFISDTDEEFFIIDKTNWQSEKFIFGSGLNITSKIYKNHDFIQKHNIKFDESLLFAEDVLFNLDAIHAASRITFLTRFEGYLYRMHEGSMIHTLQVNFPDLIHRANGFKKNI
ncbi:glycosyltransferase [Methanobrevibacter arboriphilus]|uniref:glycosyltransferase n=1 Tax=Methanobrevibacter arboriphilus TaxID=39441 RepID=UPI001CDA66F4|nr:glycosyltransferase [Methanobrevibacter arboriphilus]